MEPGVNATADQIAVLNHVIARSPALAMTHEQMAQRIAAAATPHCVRIRRHSPGRARTRPASWPSFAPLTVRMDTGRAKKRQLWFGLVGLAIGLLAWAIMPGLVAREIAPASWQSAAHGSADARGVGWDAARRLAGASRPEVWNDIVAGAIISHSNRAAPERCQRAATKEGKPGGIRFELSPHP